MNLCCLRWLQGVNDLIHGSSKKAITTPPHTAVAGLTPAAISLLFQGLMLLGLSCTKLARGLPSISAASKACQRKEIPNEDQNHASPGNLRHGAICLQPVHAFSIRPERPLDGSGSVPAGCGRTGSPSSVNWAGRLIPRNAATLVKNSLWMLFGVVWLPVQALPAQQPAKVHRIGFLSIRPGPELREEAFRQALREVGYIEGQNLKIEWRFAKGQGAQLPDLAAQLIGLKPDLIVTAGTEATQAAKRATAKIPLVTTGATDPVGSGMVKSLAHPGGNVTGLSLDAPGLGGKRIEILKEAFPKLARIAVLYLEDSASSKKTLVETKEAARVFNIRLQPVGVSGASELEGAFGTMTREHAEALVKIPSGLLTSFRKQISGQDIEGRQARRPPRGAADEV